jgi:hypothetical protein
MLIGSAVSGAASLIGGKMASSASKNAAQAQIDASNKAQAFNQQVFNTQQQALAPYQAAGQDALSRLTAMRNTQPLAQQAQGYVNAARYGQMPAQSPWPTGPQMQQPQGGGGMPQPQGGGGGAMVTLRAPTGETQAVPAQLADQLIAMHPGTQRVG